MDSLKLIAKKNELIRIKALLAAISVTFFGLFCFASEQPARLSAYDPQVYDPAGAPASISILQSLDQATKNPNRSRLHLNSGIEINGKLKEFIMLNGRIAFLQFSKETKISEAFVNQPDYVREIPNQGDNWHKEGYATAFGDFNMKKEDPKNQNYGLSSRLKNFAQYFRFLDKKTAPTPSDFVKTRVILEFDSGLRISAKLMGFTKHSQTKKVVLLTLVDCFVTYTDPKTNEAKTLISPDYGVFDLVVANEVGWVR